MDMKGWDAVFVRSLVGVNEQLAANMHQLVSTFDLTKDRIRISGTFGAWQIVETGSGKLLRFETPITDGTLEVTLPDGQVSSHDLSGIRPLMEMQLTFINNTTGGNQTKLKFNCTLVGHGPGDQTPGAVTTVDPDVAKKVTDPEVTALIRTYLPEVFIANREQLAYPFAQVNLVPPASASWLAPKYLAYLYLHPTTGHLGFLAILSLTTTRDVSKLPLEVDGTLLDTTHEVFLLVSNRLFLEHQILPMLPAAYGHGATPANFAVQNVSHPTGQVLDHKDLIIHADGTATHTQVPVMIESFTDGKIINQGNLTCNPVHYGAEDYYPIITALEMVVQDASMVSTIAGYFDITGLAGASVTFTVVLNNKFAYDSKTNAISFLPDPNPIRNSVNHIPTWEWIVAAIGGPIIIAVVDLVIYEVTSALGVAVTNSVGASGQNSLAQAGPAVVSWTGMEHFQITDMGLHQHVYLRGTYRPTVNLAAASDAFVAPESADAADTPTTPDNSDASGEASASDASDGSTEDDASDTSAETESSS
jgi:hypothetical protein